MKISLILATKDRLKEVQGFIRSLSEQEHDDLELIVVDQNAHEEVEMAIGDFHLPFRVVYLRSAPGLSRARNLGLPYATGDLIGFPDDDCWYPPGLIRQVVAVFQADASIDGVTGRSEDGHSRPSGGSFSRVPTRVSKQNVWKTGISYTLFLRSTVCSSVGHFDEELGVGAKTRFGSGEESDYLIRAVKRGFKIRYLPELVVFHPNPVLYDKNHRDKAFRYGAGMGRVLCKHGYAINYNCYVVARPILGALLSLATFRCRKAAYHFAIAAGRLSGLLFS